MARQQSVSDPFLYVMLGGDAIVGFASVKAHTSAFIWVVGVLAILHAFLGATGYPGANGDKVTRGDNFLAGIMAGGIAAIVGAVVASFI
jgi:hypothetical protein